MQNILLQSTDAVSRGEKFYVDLRKRNLTIGKRKIINGGKYKGELGVEGITPEEFKETVEYLYHEYKHSVPTEASNHKRKTYFKALDERDLSDEDMVCGERRDAAQCLLEVFVLCCAINGIDWSAIEPRCGFFWQSKEDKQLVVLREWVAPPNLPQGEGLEVTETSEV